jgi:hypothetical protein
MYSSRCVTIRNEQKNRKNLTVKKKSKKLNCKKKLIKPIKILKKPASSVQFWFYKPKTKKTEPNPNQKKTKPNRPKSSQTEKTDPNQFKPVFVLKNQTEPKPVGLNRFQFGFGFFKKKIRFCYFFL